MKDNTIPIIGLCLASGASYGIFQIVLKRVNTGVSQATLLAIVYILGLMFVGMTYKLLNAPPPEGEVLPPPPTSLGWMITALVILSVVAYMGDKFAVMANYIPGSSPSTVFSMILLTCFLVLGVECLIEKIPPNRYQLIGCALVVVTALFLGKGDQVFNETKKAKNDASLAVTQPQPN